MNQPNEFFEQAKEFMNDKQYEKALEYFNICCGYDYKPEEVLFEKIKIFFEMKNWIEVEKYCIEYLKKTENEYMRTEVQINLAKIYKFTGRCDQAIKLVDSINKESIYNKESFDIERLDISYSRYNDYFKSSEFSGDRKEIYAEFQKIKGIKPFNPAVLFFLMRISNYFHDYEYTSLLFNGYSALAENEVFYKNAILNEYEIASGTVVLKSFPRNLWIAVSSKCNISCVMCHSNDFGFEMSENNMDKILAYFKYLEHITWWGGEPTISDKFYKLLSKALEYKNIKHTIITNGQYMPDNLVDLIVKNNIEVILSVDSFEKETYESIRRGASFEKLLKTIEILSPLKEKGSLKINYVVMQMNKDEVKKIFNFLKKHCISKIGFIPGCGDKKTINNFELSEYGIKEFEQEINEGLNNIEIFNSCNIIKKNDTDKIDCKNGVFCHTPWTSMTFSYSGAVYPDNLCRFFNDNEFILDETNLLDYWNSSYVVELRKTLLKTSTCNVNCPQANVTENI